MKKVFLSIGAVLFITLAAVNVNIAVKGESVAKLSLKNIIALADVEDDKPKDGEGGSDLFKVNYKQTHEWEEYFYSHINNVLDQRFTYVHKCVICEGIGSISCTDSWVVTAGGTDIVRCQGGH
ncbi:MAG: NVEALA domain-containing protein [Bacteroidales bacterium]|jgi:hypothetical protein|nr:NVEALA domain-containing protein [Bacteroidales bacterium]